MQETPLSSAMPGTVAVVRKVQALPFHCIANVDSEAKVPTARQCLESEQATALSCVDSGSTAETDHLVPSQDSANALRPDMGEENE